MFFSSHTPWPRIMHLHPCASQALHSSCRPESLTSRQGMPMRNYQISPACLLTHSSIRNPSGHRCVASLAFSDPNFLPINYAFESPLCDDEELHSFNVPLGAPNGDACVHWYVIRSPEFSPCPIWLRAYMQMQAMCRKATNLYKGCYLWRPRSPRSRPTELWQCFLYYQGIQDKHRLQNRDSWHFYSS